MQVKEISTQLHLSYISKNFDSLCDEAKNTHMPYSEFLIGIFDKELENRKVNRLQKRIHDGLPPFSVPTKMLVSKLRSLGLQEVCSQASYGVVRSYSSVSIAL